MRGAWTAQDVRAAEERLFATVDAAQVMRRAARAVALRSTELLTGSYGKVYGARVVVLAGSGHNGGDALYAGADLAARGARVEALLLDPARAHPAALACLRRTGGRAYEDLAALTRGQRGGRVDLVLDGITGIGGRGVLREPAARAVEALAGAPVVAVDVPSGVDADTGAVDGPAVRADLTVTFGCLKPGLLVGAGARHAGAVDVADIGLAPHLAAADSALAVLDADDVAALVPDPPPDATKYTRGVVGVVAGSDAYTGAAVLAVGGALAAGAGMVRAVTVAHPAELVRQQWPEAVVTVVPAGDDGSVADADAVIGAGRVQAWVVGPGLGTGQGAARVLAALLRTDLPVLVDADGLTVVAGRPDLVRGRAAPTLLTPHDGEFARLAGAPPGGDRLAAVRRLAADLGVAVLLKGDATLVATPAGPAYANPTGTPWLATAGSGDVLSGIAGALLAAPAAAGATDAALAGAAAAFVHGLAGRYAADGAPTTADGVRSAVPAALRAVRAGVRPAG